MTEYDAQHDDLYDDDELPPDDGKRPLRMSEVRRMSQDEINANWHRVTKAMERDR